MGKKKPDPNPFPDPASHPKRRNDPMNPKQIAAEAAVEFIEDGMVVGLGTGSTTEYAVRKVGALVRAGKLRIVGVPTSLRTEKLALEEKIPLSPPGEVESIDITIDGADEIDESFDMIKGGGGAHLREKLIATMTRREIIVVDESKLVSVLGAKFAVPVEVVPFAAGTASKKLEALGSRVQARRLSPGREGGGEPAYFHTDNGNRILDCKFPEIPDPTALEKKINEIVGVVENGLFVGLAHTVCIGTKSSEKALVREKPSKNAG
jgi:ribose 5-phosphate isomerase A